MYTPEQVVVVTYQLVFQIDLFLDNCNILRRKEPADKTWTAFKVFFESSHQDWQELQVTTAGAGFQTANAAVYHQDTVEAIANLATATSSDRAAVAVLSATNITLSTDLMVCQAKLAVALQDVTKISNQNSDLRRQAANQTKFNPASKPTNQHYYWNHGYKCDHPGFTCPAPGAGHEPKVARRDTKGGTTQTAEPL